MPAACASPLGIAGSSRAECPLCASGTIGPSGTPASSVSAYGLGAGLVRDVLALANAAPAGVRSPDLLTAAGTDLKAMPLQDLIALHSAVNLLGDVAAAISCQPKSMTGDRWNAAGSMVNWLGNGLSDTTEAVAAEMRARGASGRIEQSQRLATLAPAILDGGDPAAALAREILAAVEV